MLYCRELLPHKLLKFMPLFKYVTFERLDILKNEHIRFTQPSAFNDPFELFPYFEAIAPKQNIEEFIQDFNWDESEVNKMLEESWQGELKKYPGADIPFASVQDVLSEGFEQFKPLIISFFRNFMSMKGARNRDLAVNTIKKSLNDTIGILSLSEIEDNILMWSHYSADHTGFVIEFDEKHPFFDQRKKSSEMRRHVKRVRYSDKRPRLTIFDPNLKNDEHIDKWIKDFLWVKS
jgi:hypothetical protein